MKNYLNIFFIIILLFYNFNLSAFSEDKIKQIELIIEDTEPIEKVNFELLSTYSFDGKQIDSPYLDLNDVIFEISDPKVIEIEGALVIGLPGEPPKMGENYPEMITLVPALSVKLKIKQVGVSKIYIKHKKYNFTFGVLEIIIKNKVKL